MLCVMPYFSHKREKRTQSRLDVFAHSHTHIQTYHTRCDVTLWICSYVCVYTAPDVPKSTLHISSPTLVGVFELCHTVDRNWPLQCVGAYICSMANPQDLPDLMSPGRGSIPRVSEWGPTPDFKGNLRSLDQWYWGLLILILEICWVLLSLIIQYLQCSPDFNRIHPNPEQLENCLPQWTHVLPGSL